MKHKITINVADQHGQKTQVLKGAVRKFPARLLKLLFGDFTQVYLLSPGQTVQSVDIQEIREGGQTDVKNE